jgi:hypothetical protein
MRGNYSLAEERFSSQEGVRSLEFVSKEGKKTEIYIERGMVEKRDKVIFLDV